jgi:HEAT repeat protein
MKRELLLALAAVVVGGVVCLAQEDEPQLSGKPLSQWVKQLRSENRGLQIRASQALSAAPTNLHAVIVPLVVPVLKSERENDRFVAAQVLGEYGPASRRAVPELLPLLKGTQYERNRAAAAKALGQILKDAPPSAEVEQVAEALAAKVSDDYDSYTDVRCNAVRAIGTIGLAAVKVIPKLDRVLSEVIGNDAETILVKRATAWTLGRMGPRSAEYMDRLVALMHKDLARNPDVVEAIGCIGPLNENVVRNILDVIEPADAMRGVMEAYVALEKFGPRAAPAVPLLCRLLKGRGMSPVLRIQIVRTLKAIGPAAAEAAPILPSLCAGKTPDDYYATELRGITPEQIAELKKACAEALEAFRSKQEAGK